MGLSDLILFEAMLGTLKPIPLQASTVSGLRAGSKRHPNHSASIFFYHSCTCRIHAMYRIKYGP
jgi:hypothetical protein